MKPSFTVSGHQTVSGAEEKCITAIKSLSVKHFVYGDSKIESPFPANGVTCVHVPVNEHIV